MSLLSGLGNWLRHGLDDIGSVFTGQPAHSPQPNQPNQPQQVQQQNAPQQNSPQLIIKSGGNFKPPVNPMTAPQNNPQTAPAPPKVNLNATNSLKAPNPLMAKQKLSLGDLRVNSQPNPQQINVPRPQPGGVHSWSTPPAQPNLLHQGAGLINRHVIKPIASADSYIGNSIGLTPALEASNTPGGFHTPIKQQINKAENFGKSIATMPIHIGQQLGNTGLQLTHTIPNDLPNTTPSLQHQYTQTKKTNGTLPAALETSLSGATDIAALAGGIKPGIKITKEISAMPRNEIGAVGKNIGEPNPIDQPIEGAQDIIKGLKEQAKTRPLSADEQQLLKTAQNSGKPVSAVGKNVGKPSVPEVPQQPKGLIIKESKPLPDGSKIILRKKAGQPPFEERVDKNTDKPFIPSAPKVDLNNTETYARTFGISKLQAQKDMADMASGASKIKQMTPEELAQLGPEEKLSISQKRQLIQNEPRQQTINQLELNPEEGSVKSAIANATALADERDARLAEAQRLGSKLDDHDKELMYRYDAGEKIDDLAKEAHNQEMFSKAAHTAADALDYSLAAGRAGGAATLRQHNYIPHNYEVSEEWLDKNKIPEDQRIKIGKEVKGFRDTHAKYGSYAQAASKGLKPLFKNPFEDIADYTKGGSIKTRNNLLQASLAKAMPDDIAPIDTVSMNGQRFRPAAGGNLPFAASEKLDKQLQGFKQAWTPTSRAGKVAEGAIRLTGKGTKKSLFALSYFHQAHIAENVNMAAILGREPGVIARGIIDEVRATGGISKSSYYRLMDRAREDGTTEYARKMGIIYQPNSQLGRFVDVYANELAKVAKEGGIPEGSQEAVDLGTIYNRLLGRDNSLVEARNPTIEKFTSYFALAPHYLRSQLRLVADAFLPKKLYGAGYDKVFKLTSPGGAARSAVLGSRVFGALLAITASAIIMQHFPSWQDAKREAGLQGNNVNPNIKIKSKNAKGEGQVMNLPTDPIGLALGFVTDPQHFFQSRYSPGLSFATKEITNKNWNGQPLSDPNQPNSIIIRTKNAALNSVTPIGIQNFTNLQGNQNNPNIEQGASQEVGFRLKTDPNDPQVQANKAYFDGLKQVTNDLKTKNGQFGQYWAQQFSNLHPSNTTDASGAKYPTPYNPVSSEQKYAAYAAVDANGHQVLSPVFYADQKLANMTPGYPSSPIYKLQGNGTDVTGTQAPKALVALQYQHAQDPAAQLNIMNANGGQNGWLSQYEGQVADYSKNYQSNLTNYFKGLGWTPQAINNYWSKHPSTPDPIDTLNFDKPTTDLINRYYQLSASGDSTAASTFFSQHADVLGPAFDQTAQHSNALRAAKGELQLQGYPAESAHVQQVLDSMPQGSDSASKKARALAITGNPDVNQYLADVALYEALAKGAQFRYKNPANMSATEGQNINNSGQAGQTFLKDTVSLGNYDIGKNALGQYDFMGAGGNTGGFGNGYSAGGGSGGYKSSSKKIPFFVKKRVTKVRPHYAKKAHKVFLNKGKPIKIASGGAGKHSAVKIKSSKKSVKLAKAKPLRIAGKTGVTFS